MRGLRFAVPAAVATAVLPAPAAAAPRIAPCTPGEEKPLCHVWTGTVKPVDDGDTINVKIAGDGIKQRVKVRLTGIQAMELSSYSRKNGRVGECHAVEATERLQQVIRATGRRVRLAALHEESATGARERLRRHVSVRYAGAWVDVGALMLREGRALWFPNRREWAWNRSYSQIAAEAAAAGIGIWDTDACGSGPQQESPLTMKVKWDGGGTERGGMTREWARITNIDSVNPVSLRGWWFRDSHLRRYRFPASAVVPPGGSVKVFAGLGTTTAGAFYWGQPAPVFENVIGGRRSIGDGAYLFDPDGDLRAWVQYPCRVACHEPLRRKVQIKAYARRELVLIRNTSSAEISLEGYDLESSPWFYEFGKGETLKPGKALALWIQGRGCCVESEEDPTPGAPPPPGGPPGPPPEEPGEQCENPLDVLCPTALAAAGRPPQYAQRVKAWGFPRPLLGNRRDRVTLRNPLGAPVVCHAWGGTDCPGA